MKDAKGMRNPFKNYGIAKWKDIMPTILATDYKSPPIVIIYGDCNKNMAGDEN